MKRIHKHIICNGSYYYVEGITIAEAVQIVRNMFLKSIKVGDPKCTFAAAEAEVNKRMAGCNFTYVRPMLENNTYEMGRPMTEQDKYIMEWSSPNVAKATSISFEGKSFSVTLDAFEAILRV